MLCHSRPHPSKPAGDETTFRMAQFYVYFKVCGQLADVRNPARGSREKGEWRLGGRAVGRRRRPRRGGLGPLLRRRRGGSRRARRRRAREQHPLRRGSRGGVTNAFPGFVELAKASMTILASTQVMCNGRHHAPEITGPNSIERCRPHGMFYGHAGVGTHGRHEPIYAPLCM